MNEAEWRGHIEHFKELLRIPVRDDEEGVRHDRKYDIEVLHTKLPYLLFESYQDWFDQEDDWLLRNLSLIITDEQDTQILSLLNAGDDQVLLTYLQNTCVPAWQQAAAEGGRFTETADNGAAGEGVSHYTGVENSANWAASRTPGTYYYIFDGEQYRYSDFQQGAGAEWQILRVRDEDAAARAKAWGDAGAWYTPTHGAPEYGDTHVYALDREGPWLSREAVLSQLDAAAATAARHRPADQGGSQWAWDEGWGMFYRIGPSGVYEYSHSKDEARSAPDGVWLTGEQVAQRRLPQAAQDSLSEPVTELHGGQAVEPATESTPVTAAASPGDAAVDVETALERLDALGLGAVRDFMKDLDELFAAATKLEVGV